MVQDFYWEYGTVLSLWSECLLLGENVAECLFVSESKTFHTKKWKIENLSSQMRTDLSNDNMVCTKSEAEKVR